MKLSAKKQKQFHHFCNYFKSLEIKTFLQNAIGAFFLTPFTLITYAFILAYKATFMNKSLIEALSSAVSLILIFLLADTNFEKYNYFYLQLDI